MKSIYTYYEVIQLKLRMEKTVKKLKSSMNVDSEVKSLAIGMEPHIKEYDALANKIGILGKVDELSMVNAFNETNEMLDRLDSILGGKN